MKTLTKTLFGTAAAVAMTAGSVSPATARDRDEISAGDVIAGVAILGGVIAVAAALDNDNDYDRGYQRGYPNDPRYDGGYDDRYNNGYNRQGSSRAAVEQCINYARSYGQRYGNIQVQDITRVERSRNGYSVKGRVIADNGYRGRGRGWNNDRYNNRGYDQGSFNCKVRYGRVSAFDMDGLNNRNRW